MSPTRTTSLFDLAGPLTSSSACAARIDRVAEGLEVGVDEAELRLADLSLGRDPAAVRKDGDPADTGLEPGLVVVRLLLAGLHALPRDDQVVHRQAEVEVRAGDGSGSRCASMSAGSSPVNSSWSTTIRYFVPSSSISRSRKSYVRRPSPGSVPGPIGGPPRSDGICCCQSAASWTPTRSGLHSLDLVGERHRPLREVGPHHLVVDLTPAPSIASAMLGRADARDRGPRRGRCSGSSP